MSRRTHRLGYSLLALMLGGVGACGSACGSHESTTPAQPANGTEAASEESESDDQVRAGSPSPAASSDTREDGDEDAAADGFDVSTWNELLSRYVTTDGGFRYAALKANEEDMEALSSVVEAIGSARPEEYGSREARLAFYINAYNALTISAVLEHYPTEGVMTIPGFFDETTHRVAGQEMTLNGLENDIIRAQFGEPRIHFAVNCASTGCPWLDREAFTAENLDAALERLTDAYVQRTTELRRNRRQIRVSKIFEWFEGDFEAAGGVRAFLAAHAAEADRAFIEDPRNRIVHFEYDWSLNDRP